MPRVKLGAAGREARMLSTLLCGPRSILIYFCPIGQSSSQLNLPSTPSFLPLGSFERGKNIILLFFCGHDPSFKSFRLHRILLFHFLNSTFEKFQISTKKTFYYFLLKILFKKYFCPFVDWGDGKIFKWVLLGVGCNSTVENMASCLKVVGWALWMLSSFLFLPFS